MSVSVAAPARNTALQGKQNTCGFLNFLTNISPDCDCFSWDDTPISPDLGILASKDAVAIGQASVNMVNKAPGLPNSVLTNLAAEDKIREATGVNWEPILIHGEKIGLGTRRLKQVNVK